MRIRDATPGDLPALEPLWRAFEDEIPEPPWVDVDARAIYARWGFEERELTLATPLDELAQRLAQSH